MSDEHRIAERRAQEIIEQLKARADTRVTPQRMAIIRAVTAEDHPSVDQVYQAVRADFPMTSLATVYKTLSLLEEMGEATSLGSTDDVVHYDARTPEPHAHAVCLRCGRIQDLPSAALEPVVARVGDAADGWSLTARVDVWGLCADCAKAAEH